MPKFMEPPCAARVGVGAREHPPRPGEGAQLHACRYICTAKRCLLKVNVTH